MRMERRRIEVVEKEDKAEIGLKRARARFVGTRKKKMVADRLQWQVACRIVDWWPTRDDGKSLAIDYGLGQMNQVES